MSDKLSQKIKRFSGFITAVTAILTCLFVGTLALITQEFKHAAAVSDAAHQQTLIHQLTNDAIAAAAERDLLRKTALRQQVEDGLDTFLIARRMVAAETQASGQHHSDLADYDGPPTQSRLAELAIDVAEARQSDDILRKSNALIAYADQTLLPAITTRFSVATNELRRLSLVIFWVTLMTMTVFLIAMTGIGKTLFQPLAKEALQTSTLLATAQGELERMEFADHPTGLPSKRGLERFLSSYQIAEGASGPVKAAIAIKLEPVARSQRLLSDTFTQKMATELAKRLTQLSEEMDFLAHCGRGRFFVLCNYSADTSQEPRLLDRIEQLLFEPITIDGSRISADLFAGYLPVLPHMDPTTLYDDAGVALDGALASGAEERVRYVEDIRDQLAQNSELAAELTLALTRNELKAHFQPQVSLRNGAITGFEALVRWYHPTRGVLAPGVFLPLITELGLDDALGEIMLNEGLMALRGWGDAGFEIDQLGLNFSQAQLRDPMLVETLRWELDRFDVEPERLAVEVLENIYVESDDDRIVTNVRALSKLGLNIDLDDFGTGTASITGLRRFCANRIKIDRSYISDLDKHLDNQKLVASMINMANGLDIEALAEGVETEEEIAFLRSLGCKTIQGYAIAKPMSFDESLNWIRDYNQTLADRRRSDHAVAV